MYNRYVPNQASFQPVGGESEPRSSNQSGSSFFERFFGGNSKNAGLSGILQSFHLDQIDKSDILLFLILLYLYWESDDIETVIILGLLLLFGGGHHESA